MVPLLVHGLESVLMCQLVRRWFDCAQFLCATTFPQEYHCCVHSPHLCQMFWEAVGNAKDRLGKKASIHQMPFCIELLPQQIRFKWIPLGNCIVSISAVKMFMTCTALMLVNRGGGFIQSTPSHLIPVTFPPPSRPSHTLGSSCCCGPFFWDGKPISDGVPAGFSCLRKKKSIKWKFLIYEMI